MSPPSSGVAGLRPDARDLVEAGGQRCGIALPRGREAALHAPDGAGREALVVPPLDLGKVLGTSVAEESVARGRGGEVHQKVRGGVRVAAEGLEDGQPRDRDSSEVRGLRLGRQGGEAPDARGEFARRCWRGSITAHGMDLPRESAGSGQ
ncbi:MAG: hypothetical protein EPO40_05660 [Myxococcaceae bacterium]|nr:MAG: hypothetical protein EPO40_05660 [Myxococcaceae bacterium]